MVEVFDVKASAADKSVHTIKDPELGEITYGDLTTGEGFEISQSNASDGDKALQMVARMLEKGGQKVTVQDLKALPLAKGTRLINLLTEKLGFLPKPKLP